jgi:hypothetical protein
MPLLSTTGAAGARAFGLFGSTPAAAFIAATGGTVYVDSTNADYKIHQFTASSNFVITDCPPSATIELMMVAGGGGGRYGGGGAGGYIWRPSFSVGLGTYSVSVGSGGAAGGYNGGDTTFGGLTAIGGGGGGEAAGGSGGGGVDSNGAAGLQPTSASGGYGNKGGNWTSGGYDGAGGGAGGAGGDGTLPVGGAGRTADVISSTGSFATFASGGYGNQNSVSFDSPAVVANSGNGGWGGGYSSISFGAGQAGIVRIRYKFQ